MANEKMRMAKMKKAVRIGLCAILIGVFLCGIALMAAAEVPTNRLGSASGLLLGGTRPSLSSELDPAETYFDPCNGGPIVSTTGAPADPLGNYTFEGWYTARVGGTLATTYRPGSIYYAHWKDSTTGKTVFSEQLIIENGKLYMGAEEADTDLLSQNYGITFNSATSTLYLKDTVLCYLFNTLYCIDARQDVTIVVSGQVTVNNTKGIAIYSKLNTITLDCDNVTGGTLTVEGSVHSDTNRDFAISTRNLVIRGKKLTLKTNSEVYVSNDMTIREATIDIRSGVVYGILCSNDFQMNSGVLDVYGAELALRVEGDFHVPHAVISGKTLGGTGMTEAEYSTLWGAMAIEGEVAHQINIHFIPALEGQHVSGVSDPVYGTAANAKGLFDIAVLNFEQAPTLAVQWKGAGEDNWAGTAPAGVSISFGSIVGESALAKVTTSATTPAGNYVFRVTNGKTGTGMVATDALTLTVEKKTVPVPAIDPSVTIYYNGQTQTLFNVAQDADYRLTQSSDLPSQKLAGTYHLSFELKDTANTKWGSGTPSLDVTIHKQKITPPTADTTIYSYDGTPKTYQLATSSAYRLTADSASLTHTDAGTYTIKLELIDTANTEWSAAGIPTYSFRIGKSVYNGVKSYTLLARTDKEGQTGTITPELLGLQNLTGATLGAFTSVNDSGHIVSFTGATYAIAKVATETTVKWKTTVSSKNYQDFVYEIAFSLISGEIQHITAQSIVATFGDQNVAVKATTDGNGTLSYSVKSGVDVVSVAADGKITILKAGQAVIEIKASKTQEYAQATLNINVTINRKEVAVPAADTTTFNYNGQSQTYNIPESSYYTVTGNKQTNVGTYTVKVALKDKVNTKWASGSETGDRIYSFVIGRATLPDLKVTLKSWNEGETPNTPVVTGNTINAPVVFTYCPAGGTVFTRTVPTKAGKYVVKATVAATGNYGQSEATAEFEILHVLKTYSRVSPTCTANGCQAYYYCEVCHTYFSDAACTKVITNIDSWRAGDGFLAALGHTGGVATCSSRAICTRCGRTYGAIAYSNHVGDTELRNVIEATCIKEGYSGDLYCLGCQQLITKGEVVPLQPHRGGEADCCHRAICEVCHESYGNVDKDNHKGGVATCCSLAICEMCHEPYGQYDYNNHVGETETVNYREPTCMEAGYTGDIKCKSCGGIVRSGASIPTKPHTPDKVTREVAASCTQEGYTGDIYCSVCGTKVEDGKVIPKTAHVPELRNVKEATKDEEGYTGDTYCQVCGELLEAGEVIPKLENGSKGNDDPDDPGDKPDKWWVKDPEGNPSKVHWFSLAALALFLIVYATLWAGFHDRFGALVASVAFGVIAAVIGFFDNSLFSKIMTGIDVAVAIGFFFLVLLFRRKKKDEDDPEKVHIIK